jgi:transmembrane sensor
MMANSMDDQIIEQAADWVTRLQGGSLHPRDREQLAAWLDDSAEHRRVFERMAGVLERTEVLQSLSPETGRAASVTELRPVRTAATRWYVPTGAIAAAAALVGLLFLFAGSSLNIDTAIGERRTVPLEDGSVMHLNVLSSVTVRFSNGERRVEIENGEALFEIARDAARPFVVTTDGLTVTVLGTTFNVTAYDAAASVTVVEGKVAVQTTDALNPQSVELTANDQFVMDANNAGRVGQVASAEVTAWREGWLYLSERPLQELVDRLNRQYHGSIEIADPALAAMKVNVVLRLDGREATLKRLQQLLPLTAETSAGQRTRLRARN